jgi:hypothetical protein
MYRAESAPHCAVQGQWDTHHDAGIVFPHNHAWTAAAQHMMKMQQCMCGPQSTFLYPSLADPSNANIRRLNLLFTSTHM